jgi:hypothetical protein
MQQSIVDKIESLQLLTYELNNAVRMGTLRGKALETYGVIGGKHLATVLHMAEAMMFHIAVVATDNIVKERGDDTGTKRWTWTEDDKKFSRNLRNKLTGHTHALMRLFYGDAEKVTRTAVHKEGAKVPYKSSMVRGFKENYAVDFELRPKDFYAGQRRAAIAGLMLSVLPLLTQVTYQNKASLEYAVLQPLVDLLTTVAWKFTSINGYEKGIDNFTIDANAIWDWQSKLPEFTLCNYRDFRRVHDDNMAMPKSTLMAIKAMVVDVTAPDFAGRDYTKGEFIRVAGMIYVTKASFTLKPNDGSALDMSVLGKIEAL